MGEGIKVAIIGSGNWGSAVAKLIANNIASNRAFDPTVKMWVYEEQVNNQPLSKLINEKHENVKYLPGIRLPDNVLACPCIKEVSREADVFVFVVPHEFVQPVVSQIAKVEERKKKAIGVSLSKGALFGEKKIELISASISEALGMRVSALMGANIANDVAKDLLSEGTLGYEKKDDLYKLIPMFNCSTYRVTPVQNVGIPEICGVLKNVVAVGCGLADGKSCGVNAGVAIMRNGFIEMIKFCDKFVKETGDEKRVSRVFLESSGFADLVVSCTSGRNYKFSKMAVEEGKTLEEIEKSDKMGGQKLQGYSTSKDLYKFLERKEKLEKFPLLKSICEAAAGKEGAIEAMFDAVTPEYKKTSEKYSSAAS